MYMLFPAHPQTQIKYHTIFQSKGLVLVYVHDTVCLVHRHSYLWHLRVVLGQPVSLPKEVCLYAGADWQKL